MYDVLQSLAMSPVTGDKFKPWIAAVILIVSIVVLAGLFLFSRKDDTDQSKTENSYEDEDE